MATLLLLRLELYLSLSLLLPMYVLGATYAIPSGWNIWDHSRIRFPGKASLRPDYYVVNNGASDVVSDNGMIALLFHFPSLPLDFGTSRLNLAVISKDSFYIIAEKNIYDYSECGTYICQLTSIEVDDCGTATLWDRDYPVYELSTLILPLGPACLAVEHSEISPEATPRVEIPGGFTLVSYGESWRLKKGYNLHQDDSSECSENHKVSLLLEKNGSVTVMDNYNSAVKHHYCEIPSTTLRFRKLDLEDKSTPVLPFLTLTSTGDLALHKLNVSQQTWVVDSVLMLDSSCKSAMACGQFNVCDLNGECNPLLAIGNTENGSQKLSYAWQHRLNWTRRGVGYSITKFMDSKQTDLKTCGHHSFTSFYDHSTGRCYKMGHYPGGSLHRDENMTAFINFNANTNIEEESPPPTYVSSIGVFGRAALSTGAVIVVIHLAFTISAIFFLPSVQRKLSYMLNPVKEVETLLSTMQGLPQRFSYMELEAATRGFATKLGAGGFGSVYEGFVGKDLQHVAVKKLNDNGTEGAKQFVAELSGIGGVSHYNIVKLCGFCIEGASKKLLVYEFMPNGSLDRWLFGKDSVKILSWEQRFNIALGTARGLFYLHEECSEPILHLDIKPQNILLDDKFEAKVADFGMAKTLANRDVTHVETNVRGTPGYMAPEWLLQYAATKKCDVYSYGMLLLELIGGRKNIDFRKIEDGVSSGYFPAWVVDRIKEKDIVKVVDERMRESASMDDVEAVMKVALWCIQENPAARPSMGEIMEMLQMRKKVEEPPMSFCFDRAETSEGGIANRTSSLDSTSFEK